MWPWTRTVSPLEHKPHHKSGAEGGEGIYLAINEAEAKKQAEILKAEGDARAIVLNAQAEADAIMRVAEAVAATKTDPATYMLAVKYIETLKEMTSGKDNKTVYIPYEASSVLSSLGSINTLFNKQ